MGYAHRPVRPVPSGSSMDRFVLISVMHAHPAVEAHFAVGMTADESDPAEEGEGQLRHRDRQVEKSLKC